MSVSKVRRCIWLVTTIRTHSPISFEDLSREWEKNDTLNYSKEPLSKKSFHNYVDAVLDMFNIRIVCDRKGGYKYRLDTDAYSDTWTSSLIDTLCLLNDTEMRKRIVDCNTQYPMTNPETLRTVYDAARNHLPISFSWFGDDVIDNFYPAYLIKVRQKWYVVGYFTNYSQRQIVPFGLLWMSKVKIINDAPKADPPKDFDINEYLEFLKEKDANKTFGKYYTDQHLKELCEGEGGEKNLKDELFDSYYVHLGTMEYHYFIPRGTALCAAEAYYEKKLPPEVR